MVFLKWSDYGKPKTKTSVGYVQNKKGVKLPTMLQTSFTDKKFLIACPTGCTQDRSRKNRLKQKKTFDTRNNTCRNCGFKKLPADAKPVVRFEKASDLK